MNFFRYWLRKIKLFVLYFRRIVFVRNNFKVSPITKIRANIFGGFLADQYALYDFKHNDKSEYLSEFDWYRSRYINEPFDFAFNNKIICTEMLKRDVLMAENLFVKNKGILYDFRTGPVSEDDVYAELKNRGKLIMKPFAMGKGTGVHLLSGTEETVTIDGREAEKETLSELLKKEKEYLICEYINQHEYADRLYADTANTIRIISLRDTETHRMKIYFAVQRIGRDTTFPVDNGSKGGLVAKVDLESGRLSSAKSLRTTCEFPVHPDTGAPIEGVAIPGWSRIKKEILGLCDKLPYMDFIAWDALLTEEGRLCIIEANSSSGVNILQLWGGQRNRELGDFFRHYKVIR